MCRLAFGLLCSLMFRIRFIFAFPDYHMEIQQLLLSFSFYYLPFFEIGKKQSAVCEP